VTLIKITYTVLDFLLT